MNLYFKYLIKKALDSRCVQGYSHEVRIREIYALIREVCVEEFPEDNAPTMDAFLRELFESTQHSPKNESNCK